MFTGTVEARSHEGGLLVHFEGSSPALNAIMIRADDGTYIGKVDGVIGSTNHPLAHVAHIDRSLDMDTLIGVSVTVRAKQKPREQRNDRRTRRDDGRHDRRGRDDNRGFRNDRDGGRQQRGTFNDNDWTCPECKNSNFAFRNVCNRCEAPRPGGGGGRQDDRRGRDNNRGFRNDRDGGRQQRGTVNDNDWTCPECKNSNFAFRNVCNRCEAPRPGGGGGRRDDRRGRDNNRGFRNDRGGRRDDRGFRNDRGGRRDNRQGRDNNRGFRNDRNGGSQQRGTYNDNDWTCAECKNSNFAFRKVCNRCEAPRPGGGGGGGGGQYRNDRRTGSYGNQRRDHRGGSYGNQRRDGERGRQQGGRGGGGRFQNRRSSDVQPRRAKGKRSGHAHNQPPRDFRSPRKFERRDD